MKTELKLNLVLSTEKVRVAVNEIAEAIRKIGSPMTLVVILKGGVYTAHEVLKVLAKKLDGPLGKKVNKLDDIIIGYIGLSSYENSTKSQGYVKVMSPLDLSAEYVKGRNVVIIDDCVETGNTLYWAEKMISVYEPSSVHTAVLVDKVFLREKYKSKKPAIVGYNYNGGQFLLGCGMGWDERYRNLPGVYGFDPSKLEKMK